MMKLSIRATALTIAIVWGLGLYLITWWLILFEGTSTDVAFISKIYRGYTITPLGSIIGFVWAFIDGAIGGVCIAWVYNKLAEKEKTTA